MLMTCKDSCASVMLSGGCSVQMVNIEFSTYKLQYTDAHFWFPPRAVKIDPSISNIVSYLYTSTTKARMVAKTDDKFMRPEVAPDLEFLNSRAKDVCAHALKYKSLIAGSVLHLVGSKLH